MALLVRTTDAASAACTSTVILISTGTVILISTGTGGRRAEGRRRRLRAGGRVDAPQGRTRHVSQQTAAGHPGGIRILVLAKAGRATKNVVVAAIHRPRGRGRGSRRRQERRSAQSIPKTLSSCAAARRQRISASVQPRHAGNVPRLLRRIPILRLLLAGRCALYRGNLCAFSSRRDVSSMRGWRRLPAVAASAATAATKSALLVI